MERLTTLYDEYLAQLHKFKSKMKPADGLLGFGTGLGDAPCHEEFAEKLELLISQMAGDSAFADSRRALEYIFQAPLNEEEQAAYWMMMAVHKLTPPLIGRLDAEEARRLFQWYQEAYPRSTRLPPQNTVIKALKEKGHISSGFFGRSLKFPF